MRASNVLISGAGIAGPTLAYWLSRHGFVPTLVERAPALRTGGYIIDFWGTGYDVAERMGLLPQLRPLGYDIQEVRAVASDGAHISGFSADAFRDATQGRYLSIARGDLAETIYGALDGQVEAIFGDSIEAISQDDSGVDVTFAHMTARRFDLVVGADGLHSKVRALGFGTEQAFESFLGYRVVAFEAAGYRPRDERTYVGYSQPGKLMARVALRDDRSMFMAVFADDERDKDRDGRTPSIRHVMPEQFDNAGWECRAILEAMDACDVIYHDRVSQIRMPGWSSGRMALIGDAAACPSLLAGEGTALAMTEAFVLAGELAAAGGEHTVALRTFEDRLRALIERKQHAAANFAGAFAPRTAFGLFVRNLVTRAMGFAPVARLVAERSLTDRFTLPDYAEP